jgi:glycine/D-amino acid oxidase-like deaminating enzyme
MDRSADVVVIGGGIAGTTTAYYLAKRGMSVIVCEKGEIAGEQSSRNWGFVRQQRRDPAEIPLMMASNKIWQDLSRELNTDIEWIQGGNLNIFDGEEAQTHGEAWLEHAQAHGLESKLISKRELDALVPGNAIDCPGALFTESDGQAEPTKVTEAFRRAAEGRGVEFLTHCAVFEIETAGGAVSGVITERGGITAKTVVLAAGAWTGRMMRTLDLKFPQIWVKGSVARTTAVPIISHAATWSGVAFRQRRDGTMNVSQPSADHDITMDTILNAPRFISSFRAAKRDVRLHLNRMFMDTAMGPFSKTAFGRELQRYRILDPEPNMQVLAQSMEKLKKALPMAKDIEIERSWAGYIDLTPDMLPTLDSIDTPAGLVIASGFSGHGFGMGPIVGTLMAELIADGQTTLDLSAFRFARFSDGSKLTPYI